MKSRLYLAVAAGAGLCAGALGSSAMANTFYAVNSGGNFYVSSSSVIQTFAQSVQADPTHEALLATNVGGYADSGIVLDFDGSLKLGDLSNLTVTSAGVPLSVNLWLDTGNNGQFFAFDGSLPGAGKLTSLDSDSYLGTNIGTGTGVVDDSSSFFGFAGNGVGGNFSLSQLKAGTVSGIDANTKVALWIGLVGTGNGGAVISDVSVNGQSINPTAVPLPSSAWMGLALIGGVGSVGGIKRMRRHAV